LGYQKYFKGCQEMTEIEMFVASIRLRSVDNKRMLILNDAPKRNYLCIPLDKNEAAVLISALQGNKEPCYVTYPKICDRISEVGSAVSKTIVNDYRGDKYKANLVIDLGNGGVQNINCGAVEAVTIATAEKAPIYADEAVIKKAGVKIEDIDSTYSGNSMQSFI